MGLSPGYLLLGGSNGNNGGGGLRYLLLLLLLAGNEGGGRKGKNSDGLHNYLELVLMFEAARLPRVGRGHAKYTAFFAHGKPKMSMLANFFTFFK